MCIAVSVSTAVHAPPSAPLLTLRCRPAQFGNAERLLRRSLVCEEATQTRLALARALHRQHAYESALSEYRAVLAATADAEEGAAARAAAEDILRVLGRDSEIPTLPSPAVGGEE